MSSNVVAIPHLKQFKGGQQFSGFLLSSEDLEPL